MPGLRCASCNDTINPKQDYRLVTGFVKARPQGGTNSLALRKIIEPQVWKCRFCIEER